MKVQQFPRIFFIITSTLIFVISCWLAIYWMQQSTKAELEQTFTSLTERLRGEFATIKAFESGLVANTLTIANIENNTDRELNLYAQLINDGRSDVNFFILPKIIGDNIVQYEQQKQENGYLNFHVFGNADVDPFNNNPIYFPLETIKQNKINALKHLGRDIYSYPNFKDAIDDACKNNKMVAAWSHVTADNTHGIMLFQPVYDTKFIDTIPESERMNHVQAMVSSEVFLDNLVKNSINQLDIDDLAFEIVVHTYDEKQQVRSSVIAYPNKVVHSDWLPIIQLSQELLFVDKPVIINMNAIIGNHQLSWHSATLFVLTNLVLISLLYALLTQKVTHANERLAAKKAFKKEHYRAETTLASLGEGVVTTDVDGRILYLNPKAKDILGTGSTDTTLEGKLLNDIYPENFQTEIHKVMEYLTRCIEQNQIIQLNNIQTINRHGDQVLLDCTLSPMHQDAEQITGVAIVLEDVTHLEEMRSQIENMAKRDHLTGLFNRYEFEHQLKNTIIDAHKRKVSHAFCYLDLDQFKIVNDTAGHIAGDQLLRQLAGTVFLRSTPADAILGRLGGDEFGLLLFNTTPETAIAICQQIIQDIQQFIFLWQNKRFQVGVSIGLVMIDDLSLSVEQSLISADTACYLAKEKGRNRVESAHIDNAEVRQRQEEISWAERIPRAIEENRLVLFIQYILGLD